MIKPEMRELVRLIRAHCKREGIEPSTFTQRTVRNSRLIQRLEAGGSVTVPVYQRLLRAMAHIPTIAAE